MATPGSVCVLTKSVTMQKGKPWHVAVMFKTGWMFRDSHLTFAWFGRCAFLHSHFFLHSTKIYTDTVFSADQCKLVHKGECTSLIPCALQLTPDYFYLSGVRSRGQGESTPEMAAQYLERSRKQTEHKELGRKETDKKSRSILILLNKYRVYSHFLN